MNDAQQKMSVEEAMQKADRIKTDDGGYIRFDGERWVEIVAPVTDHSCARGGDPLDCDGCERESMEAFDARL